MDLLEDLETFLKRCKELLHNQKCSKCDSENVKVRLKACDHYFCQKCRRKDLFFCPVCDIKISAQEIDTELSSYQSLKKFIQDYENLKTKKGRGKLKEQLPVRTTRSEANKTNESDTITFENKEYIIKTCDANIKVNKKGEADIHVACKTKNVEKLLDWLEKDVDINCVDYAGWSPLHEAVNANSILCASHLLIKGAFVDPIGPEYLTPLHLAVSNGLIGMIKLLLKYGASPDSVDINGSKPIEHTINEAIIKILKEQPDIIDNSSRVICIPIDKNFVIPKSQKEGIIQLYKSTCQKTEKQQFFVLNNPKQLRADILVALLKRTLFVNEKWLNDFEKGSIVPNILYEPIVSNDRWNSAFLKSTINTLLKRPKLFSGLSFYLERPFDTVLYDIAINKNVLVSLIESGSGRILSRPPTTEMIQVKQFPYHADKNSDHTFCSNYIIFNPDHPPKLQYKMPELKHRSSKWLIDCILQFKITDDFDDQN